jgi:hypothetical protein
MSSSTRDECQPTRHSFVAKREHLLAPEVPELKIKVCGRKNKFGIYFLALRLEP